MGEKNKKTAPMVNANPNTGNDDELIAVTGLIETTLTDLGNARLMILNSLAKLEAAFRYKKVREELGINKFFELTQAHNSVIALTSYIMPDITEVVKRLYNFGDSLNEQAGEAITTNEQQQAPENNISDQLSKQINSLMQGSMNYVQKQVDNLETNENDKEPIAEEDSQEEEAEESQDRSEDQN